MYLWGGREKNEAKMSQNDKKWNTKENKMIYIFDDKRKQKWCNFSFLSHSHSRFHIESITVAAAVVVVVVPREWEFAGHKKWQKRNRTDVLISIVDSLYPIHYQLVWRLVHMVVHVHCSLDTTMNTELYVCDCVFCHLQAKGRRYCNIFQFFVLFCYFMLFNSVKVNGSVLFNWNWILQTLEQSKL